MMSSIKFEILTFVITFPGAPEHEKIDTDFFSHII